MRKISTLPCLIARANGTCYDACRSRSTQSNPLQKSGHFLPESEVERLLLMPNIFSEALVVTSKNHGNFYGRSSYI